MTAVVLAVDRRLEARLLPELVATGRNVVARPGTARELLATVSAQPVDIVLVGGGIRVSAELIALCDEAGARLIVLVASESERRQAASLGLYDVLDSSADWSAIERVITTPVVPGRAGERGGATMASTPSRVIAVWGPAGAPGRTSLAITLASEIASYGHSVALVDADCYGGSVAPALGLLDEAPGFAAACRLAGNNALSHAELARVAQRYVSPRGAFWVLTGLASPSRWPELAANKVASVLRACAGWVDYVVVDTGFNLETDEEISSDMFSPRRNAATIATLQAATDVIAVGLCDPVGLSRLLRGYGDLTETVQQTQPRVVINRVRSSVVGLSPGSQVNATLMRFAGLRAAALIPDDSTGFDSAMLDARTLRDGSPKSPARMAVRGLIERELLPESDPVPERSRRRPRRRLEGATTQ